jgi:hypothetical protein
LKRDEEPSSFAGADWTTDTREPIGGTRGPEPRNELLEGATPKEVRDARTDHEGSRRRTAHLERTSTGRTSWPSLRARLVHLRVPSTGCANRGSPLRRARVDVELEASKGPPPEEVEVTTEARVLTRREEPRLTTQVSHAVGRTRGALAEGMPTQGGESPRRGGNPGPKHARSGGAVGESREDLLYVAQAACSVGPATRDDVVEHSGRNPSNPI